jgi:hypothetical protein
MMHQATAASSMYSCQLHLLLLHLLLLCHAPQFCAAAAAAAAVPAAPHMHTCSAANNHSIHSIGYLQLNQPVVCTQVKLAIGQVPAVKRIAEFRHKG